MSSIIGVAQHTPFQLLFGCSILMISSLTGKKVKEKEFTQHSIPLHSIFRVKEWRPNFNFRFHSQDGVDWTHLWKESPPHSIFNGISLLAMSGVCENANICILNI